MKYNLFLCDNFYCIHEDGTIKVLKRTKNKKLAKNILSRLNDGGGFEGDTPEFFINKTDTRAVFGKRKVD